ncbi:MAG: hypothetical protein GYA21_09310 [Myxococcales bacterium]|nr:hypothetical protein [Myxococcales bacterium]
MKILAVALLLLAPAAGSAQDFYGTRPLGMGGAFRAIATGNDAIELNPAGMSLFRHYSIEAHYLGTPKWRAEDGPYEHVIHASVVDNQTQQFATGLAYTRIERGDSKQGNRVDLAFSFPLSDNLLLGLDVYYLNFESDPKDRYLDAVTVDVGMLLRTDFGLSLGVVGYALTNPADYQEHPLSMAAAVAYSPFRSLVIGFDWFINFQRPKDLTDLAGAKETAFGYHFGAEYLVLGQMTIRAGYWIDKARPGESEQYWSAGLGWVSETLAIDAGYRGSIHHGYDGTFGVAVRMFQ